MSENRYQDGELNSDGSYRYSTQHNDWLPRLSADHRWWWDGRGWRDVTLPTTHCLSRDRQHVWRGPERGWERAMPWEQYPPPPLPPLGHIGGARTGVGSQRGTLGITDDDAVVFAAAAATWGAQQPDRQDDADDQPRQDQAPLFNEKALSLSELYRQRNNPHLSQEQTWHVEREVRHVEDQQRWEDEMRRRNEEEARWRQQQEEEERRRREDEERRQRGGW